MTMGQHPPRAPWPPPETPAEPSPTYAPRLFRVTDEQDGGIRPRMMSDRANAFVQGRTAFVFCGTDAGPRLFEVDLASGHVKRRGPIGGYGGETEGWLWLPTGRIILPHGPQLSSMDPFNVLDDPVVLDISDSHPGHDLWQPHASDDGRTFSATVRRIVPSGRYPYVGTVVVKDGVQVYYEAQGVLDESQVSHDGAYLVIKEDDDNLIVTLATGEQRIIPDAGGAVGHSDCGDSILVGEDNQHGACVLWDLRYGLEQSKVLVSTWNMGYVSVRGDRCLWSSDTHLSLVALDGSGVTPLIEHGGGSGYDERVKASMDPTGKVATYMSGGVVFLLELP